MSKSKGNVINPDEVVKEYGADTMRVYEMFMGPFEQMISWDTKGVKGARRFLGKIWRLGQASQKGSSSLRKLLHKTIKKVSEDIDSLKFNTAVSSLMEFSNAWQADKEGLARDDLKDFLKVLSPFVSHLAEELWQRAGFKGLACNQKWPEYDRRLVKEKKIVLVIQVNGKIRDRIEVKSNISEKEAKKMALAQERVKKWLAKKKVKKIIFVPDKLINFVLDNDK